MSTRKGTKWNNNDRTETINFAENIKKCSQWNCFQKNPYICIVVPTRTTT